MELAEGVEPPSQNALTLMMKRKLLQPADHDLP